jgi:hypothetical protein
MALRKEVIPFEPYMVCPEEDELSPLIVGHQLTVGIVPGTGITTHTYTSHEDQCSDIVLQYQLHTWDGEFRRIVVEPHCPRIISIIRQDGTPISMTMLVNSSASMGTAFVDDHRSLGYIGLCTRPEHQGRGVSRHGLHAIQREIDRLTRHKDEQFRSLMVVQTMGHVLDWVRQHMSVPVCRM